MVEKGHGHLSCWSRHYGGRRTVSFVRYLADGFIELRAKHTFELRY